MFVTFICYYQTKDYRKDRNIYVLLFNYDLANLLSHGSTVSGVQCYIYYDMNSHALNDLFI